MRCEEFERIILSGGEITPDMREHAQHCAACRTLMENADVLSGAREMDKGVEPPASFCRGWRAAVRRDAAMRRPSLRERLADWVSGFRHPALMRGVAVAACALVLVGVGAQLGGRDSVSDVYETYARNASPKLMSASYDNGAAYDSYEVAEDTVAGAGARSLSDGVEQSGRKLVRTAQLSVEVTDMDAAIDALTGRVQALGGMIDACEISGRKADGRWASLTLSVPSESLDGFLSDVGGLGTVTRESSQTTDMTDTYYDNASRLESARAQKQRLDELYAQAQDMSDIIEITDALYDLQWEIDALTGANQRIDTRVALSQVSISLTEKAAGEPEETPGFLTRLKESAEDGLGALGDFLESLVLFVVWAAPWLALIAAVVAAVTIVRRLRRRRR